VRVPCASSATLGNSTERVNGRLALERRSDAAKPYRDARREPLFFWHSDRTVFYTVVGSRYPQRDGARFDGAPNAFKRESS